MYCASVEECELPLLSQVLQSVLVTHGVLSFERGCKNFGKLAVFVGGLVRKWQAEEPGIDIGELQARSYQCILRYEDNEVVQRHFLVSPSDWMVD